MKPTRPTGSIHAGPPTGRPARGPGFARRADWQVVWFKRDLRIGDHAPLVEALQQAGLASQLVPMDGFHLDNSILTDRKILDRKGSPPSFDAIGLLRLVQVLGAAQELYYPVFDRARDLSIAGAGHISPECDTIVIEGNYLLMDAPIWRDMAGYWDLSIQLTCSDAELEARLIQRWLDHGLTPEAARIRAQSNDFIASER